MRAFVIFIVSFIFALPPCAGASVKFTSAASKEAAMKRCDMCLREACVNLWAGKRMPEGHAAVADTLRSALYEDSIEMALWLQVRGRLTLETYRLIADPAHADYREMRRAIGSCKNADAFFDNFFLACAMGVADKAFADGETKTAQLYYLYALKATAKMYDGKPNTFDEYIHVRLAYMARNSGDYDDEALWRMGYVLDELALHGAASGECAEAVAMAVAAVGGMSDKDKACDYLDKLSAMLEHNGLAGSDNYFSLLLSRANMAADRGDDVTAAGLYGRMVDTMTPVHEDYVASMAAAACYFYEKRDFARMGDAYARCIGAFENGCGSVADFAQSFPVLGAPTMGKAESERAAAAVGARADRRNISDLCAEASVLARAGRTDEAYAIAAVVRGLAREALAAGDAMNVSIVTGQMASMFSGLGDIDSAIEFLKESVTATEESFGRYDPSIARRLRCLIADYMQMQGDYRGARAILEECLADSSVSDSERFSIGKSRLAVEAGVGNYEKVVALSDALLRVAPSCMDEWELLTGKASALISLIDVAYGNDDEVRSDAMAELQRTVDALKDLCDREFATDAEMRVLQLIYAATTGFMANDKESMLASADAAVDVVRGRIANPELSANYMASIAMYYVKAGQYDRAAVMLGEESVAKHELDVERLYRNQLLSEIALGSGQADEARRLYVEHCADITEMVKTRFATLTEAERASYWRMFRQQIQDAGRFSAGTAGPSDFAGAVYNLELFSKGLLLNSSQSFRRLVEQTGDSVLTDKFNRYMSLSRSLKCAEGINDAERARREEEISRIETDLLSGCKAYGEFTDRLSADWHAVRAALGEDEAAVEFVQYSDMERRRYLGAAVVTQALPQPVFVPLGAEADVAGSVEADFDGNAVWGPLAPYLEPGCKVYFAAAGYLHRLPVESCTTDAGYRFYRVSSTRMLLQPRGERNESGKCALFGGIDYGFSPDAGAGGHRSGTGYLDSLPGTLAELESVAGLWRGAADTRLVFAGSEASRDCFMNLGHKDISLLHIGTHGYFGADTGTGSAGVMTTAFRPVNIEDRSLHDCGLYFAGANDAIADSTLSMDRFRVNAAEISALDFHNLNLAVLSACETAAGEISGEGVFGLQRGFKQAGAGSILMSLWKVDDEATCRLMTEFYRHWLGDASAGIVPCGKHAALEAAKAAVRANPAWAEPEYWAAFILLDAID